jgi:hypothetical protein
MDLLEEGDAVFDAAAGSANKPRPTPGIVARIR